MADANTIISMLGQKIGQLTVQNAALSVELAEVTAERDALKLEDET